MGTEKLLYEPRPFTDAKPDAYREYDIADVNPEWIKDVLGDHWEYRRSPHEIAFSAYDSENEYGVQVSFQVDQFRVTCQEIKGQAPNTHLDLVGLGKVSFKLDLAGVSRFDVKTRDGVTEISSFGNGEYFLAHTVYGKSKEDPSTSTIGFRNPKPSKKK